MVKFFTGVFMWSGVNEALIIYGFIELVTEKDESNAKWNLETN